MNVTQGRLRTLGSSLGQASPAWRRSWSPVQPQSVGVRPLEEMGHRKAEREQFLCSYCLDKILAACAGSCSEQTFNQGVISTLSTFSVVQESKPSCKERPWSTFSDTELRVQ